ncbi:hypothetical protein UVI_02006230 [Ustilaginoidea virens]|uniref:Uncharacterized protein n=1 Tax=Ustilaginoidea virens TaxID=1159556 RepID=A0A1B5L2T3_USTVR|nr:hypothetical protein UVI_02006230 [Ustilaginoidea virens]
MSICEDFITVQPRRSYLPNYASSGCDAVDLDPVVERFERLVAGYGSAAAKHELGVERRGGVQGCLVDELQDSGFWNSEGLVQGVDGPTRPGHLEQKMG